MTDTTHLSERESTSMDTTEFDKRAILEVHRKWWDANVSYKIPLMRECFPDGMNFHMFNRNSFTYFGREELTTLWEWFIETKAPVRLNQIVKIQRLDVRSDTAWIAAELYAKLERPDGTTFETRSKATEIYHRDNGQGVPEWTMWHFHSSELPADDAERQAFGDTIAQRGIGSSPWGEPIVSSFGVDIY